MPIPSVLATPRAAIMAVFAAFGATVGALAGSMPVVTRAASVDNFALGLIMTVATLATVAAMSLGGVIARHVTNRTMLLWSLPALAVLLVLTLVSGSLAAFVLAYVALGLLLGVVDLFMNAEAAAVEIDVGRSIFTTFHGSGSTGMPAMAIAASYLSIMAGPWAAGLLVAAALGVAWQSVRALVPARSLAGGRDARISSLPNKLPLMLLGISAGLSIAAEMTAILWSAKLLDAQAPELAAITGLGAAFFGLCNAVVRYMGDWLRGHLGDLPLMMGSIVIAFCGFVVLGLSGDFVTSVLAFALVGFGTAVLVPCIFTLGARYVPANPAGGMGFISMMAGGPRILAPWIFGWVVTAAGISFAFGLYAAVMAVALALVITLQRLGHGR